MNGLVKNLIIWAVIAVVLMSIFNNFAPDPEQQATRSITYSEFIQQVQSGRVDSVTIEGDKISGQMADGERFSTVNPNDSGLIGDLLNHNVEINAEEEAERGLLMSILISWFPILLLIAVWIYFMRQMQGGGAGGKGAMSFGKSKAKLMSEDQVKVTFSDVAGCDEAKDEVVELVDFLKDPGKFQKLGGQIPRGVLMVGSPGTGKTLLAKAIAGEAKVPFFSISGSDFVEMFVGVGAARVRDLFEQAQENAPCIIFVDELDAIGKSRGGGGMQTNEEREQTLNALLVEMDGFDARSGVIILGATNRPEVLDPALLRSGRFDRQVVVDRPDKKGRRQILDVHARSIVMGEDVDLDIVAAQTPGFVGADLANIVNEAALLAARKEKDAVELEDFQAAIERVIAGLEKKSRRLSEKETNIVAYHESGHAIVAGALKGADPVHKISIVSRGIGALGYTLQVPMEDRYLVTRQELKDRICSLLGGRAAEAIIFGDISSGASNDLQRVTGIARRMIAEYGMNDAVGNLNFGDSSSSFLEGSGFTTRNYSERTAELIDREVQELVEGLYKRTLELLKANMELLHEMADLLKEQEVLEGDELNALMDRVQGLGEATKNEQEGDAGEGEA